MSARGQVFSADFLIASSIFVVAIGVIFIYWMYASQEIEGTRGTSDMIDKLNFASEAWFKDGTPVHWSPDDVIEIGLDNSHQFNQTKMDSLNVLGYEKVKSFLGVGNYNIYYRVYDEMNRTLFEFGIYPYQENDVMKTTRMGILNRTIAIVDVLIWE